jgi:hypothetical protein
MVSSDGRSAVKSGKTPVRALLGRELIKESGWVREVLNIEAKKGRE